MTSPQIIIHLDTNSSWFYELKHDSFMAVAIPHPPTCSTVPLKTPPGLKQQCNVGLADWTRGRSWK